METQKTKTADSVRWSEWIDALREIAASAESAGELASADEGAKCGEVFSEIKVKAENLLRQMESAPINE